MKTSKLILIVALAIMCAFPACTTHDPQVYESQLANMERNYVPLPPGWTEEFVPAPEGNMFKGEAFGHIKVIRYYISEYSPELYWVQLHERGHALQWDKLHDMHHCSHKCVMAERGTVSRMEVYAASVDRGGKWFCDECRDEFGLE
ncbi:MAG: hypothetical protein BA863_02190 [Desulfovibrio sp. S3730MH75]|nr:MAG: hypothetical protein BA863_02190 [Desulfovibrio sp. S3730MH75]